MILLDTNICICIINARPPALLARLQQQRLGEIGLCSGVAAELACGVAKSGLARNRQALEMGLAPLAVLAFDAAAFRACGSLRVDLECRGNPIDAHDTLIAAHAISTATKKFQSMKPRLRPPCVVANPRHGKGDGCGLRRGQEAVAFARHKQSSGLFVSGLGLAWRTNPSLSLVSKPLCRSTSQQALLVTHNTREFAQVSGLQLADWSVAA